MKGGRTEGRGKGEEEGKKEGERMRAEGEDVYER